MRNKVLFFGVVLAGLSACRAHHPVPIEPVSDISKADEDVTFSTMSAVAEITLSSSSPQSPNSPNPSKTICPPAHWRQIPNATFSERESWTFDVRWGLLKAGEAVLAIEGLEPIRGRPSYHISMDMHATGMTEKLHAYRDRTDTWLDRESLTTLLIRHSVRQSRYQADEAIVLDPSCQRFKRQRRRLDVNKMEEQRGPLLVDALDVYSALFYLRTLPLSEGQSYPWMLFTGDKTVEVTAFVRRKERLKVQAGNFDCFLIEILKVCQFSLRPDQI